MAFECSATQYCGDNHTRLDLDPLPSYFTITSSTLSMLGALIALGRWILVKRYRRSSIQKVASMWAVAELVTAVSYIVAGINFITNKLGETNRCDIFETIYKTQCFVTTWFSMSSNIWMIIFMVDSTRIASLQSHRNFMPIYNIISWVCPLVVAMPLLGTQKLECIGNTPIMHHPTAMSNFSLVISGPLWVLVTFAVIVMSATILKVHMGRQLAEFRGSYYPKLYRQLRSLSNVSILSLAHGLFHAV